MSGTPLSAPREIRARWYLQAEKYGRSIREVCQIFGMSKKTYYKWYNLDHHLSFRDSKRRAIHPLTKLIPRFKMIIYETKIKYNYGPKKMKIYLEKKHGLKVTANIIYRYYKKRHLIKKPQKKQVWYMPLKEPYKAVKPGENVQLDVKYVPGRDLNWSYQYRFIDTVTNLQYAVETKSKDSLSTVWAYARAKRFFPFSIAGIQTDNGGEFRGFFHAHLVNQNIIHRYIPKRSAPWNGKVERANRSIDDEYYLNPNRPWKTLSAYTDWYNNERPHLGKGMLGITPWQKYLSLAKSKCHP
jgi:IS30 family transposase